MQLIPNGDNDAVWCIIPVASMPNNAIEVTGLSNLKPMQVAPPGGQICK